MYYSDEYYIKCLKRIAKDISDGKTNKVTDVTAIGCKDTYSTIGLCAKKYHKERGYFKGYHLCPFDLRTKLFLSNTHVDYFSMLNGCFYSCETYHKGFSSLNTIPVEDRINLLIKLVESGKAAKAYDDIQYYRGNGCKDKRMNRTLKQIKEGNFYE